MGGCCGKMSDKRRETKIKKQRQRLVKEMVSFRPKLERKMKLKILQINAEIKYLKDIDWTLDQFDNIRRQNNSFIDELFEKIGSQLRNYFSSYPTEENIGTISGHVEIDPTTYQIHRTDALPIPSDEREQSVPEDIENTDCLICLEPITDVGLANVCRHVFCKVCICEWTKIRNFCPHCRQVIEEILVVTPGRHPNDFDRILVENEETRNRVELMELCAELKKSLVLLRKGTVNLIESLKSIVKNINLCMITLDRFRNNTNQDIEKIIGQVNIYREVIRLLYDKTRQSNMVKI